MVVGQVAPPARVVSGQACVNRFGALGATVCTMDTAAKALGTLIAAVAVMAAVVYLWGAGAFVVVGWIVSLGPENGTRVLILTPFVVIGVVALVVFGALLVQRLRGRFQHRRADTDKSARSS